MCSVFWLFWLSCQYLQSDWLERLLWGSLTVARGSSPESPGRRVLMIFLVYCIVSLFIMCLCCLLALFDYFPTPVARYSLFVLKVPLSTKQTNKQTRPYHFGWVILYKMLKTYQFKTHCKGDSHSSNTANIILPGLMIKQRWTSLRLQVKWYSNSLNCIMLVETTHLTQVE